MGTLETSREPCPDRILDDLRGAFAMGAVGGSVFHFIKGSINSPKGERFLGGVQTMRVSAPRTGGGFAVWCGLFSTFDCAMVYVHQKEDPRNSIFAGAATGGFLQMRQGLRSSARSAAFGGTLLALIKGVGIMFNRVMSPPPQIVYEDPNMARFPGQGGQMGQMRTPQGVDGAQEVGSQGGGGGGFGLFGWLFGGGKKEESSGGGGKSGGGSEATVLESFDTPTPMPNFEYK